MADHRHACWPWKAEAEVTRRGDVEEEAIKIWAAKFHRIRKSSEQHLTSIQSMSVSRWG